MVLTVPPVKRVAETKKTEPPQDRVKLFFTVFAILYNLYLGLAFLYLNYVLSSWARNRHVVRIQQHIG